MVETASCRFIKRQDDASTIKRQDDASTIKRQDDASTLRVEMASCRFIKRQDDASTIKRQDDASTIKRQDDASTLFCRRGRLQSSPETSAILTGEVFKVSWLISKKRPDSKYCRIRSWIEFMI